MFLPTPTPAPSMAWCLADCSTTLLSVPGLEFPLFTRGEVRGGGGSDFHHVPVLLEEVIHYLAPAAGKLDPNRHTGRRSLAPPTQTRKNRAITTA